jgi:hypothetical protein
MSSFGHENKTHGQVNSLIKPHKPLKTHNIVQNVITRDNNNLNLLRLLDFGENFNVIQAESTYSRPIEKGLNTQIYSFKFNFPDNNSALTAVL